MSQLWKYEKISLLKGNKREEKMEIKKIEEEIKNCKKCRLWKERKNPVPGEGNYNAKLMLIGEAPGKNEDEEGRPFVGNAGKILNNALEKNGIDRKSVYITNVVKCHPPKNRAPYEDEIKKCSHYLQKQIELINPEIIATLGNFSTKTIFRFFGFKEEAISKLHGKIFVSPLHNIKIFPTFHPAACIYNPFLLDKFEKDIEKLAEIFKSLYRV